MSRPKICLIVPHDEKEQGAISYNGISEFKYGKFVAEEVFLRLGEYDCEVYAFTKNGHDYSNITEKYPKMFFDVSIELHFNSFYKPAFGMEALLLSDSKEETVKFVDRFTDFISQELDIKERRNVLWADFNLPTDGISRISRNQRGAVCLRAMADSNVAKHVFLFEPAFCNKETADSRKLFETSNSDLYPKALCNALISLLNISRKDDEKQMINLDKLKKDIGDAVYEVIKDLI